MVDIQTTGIMIAAASVVVTAIIMTWQNIEARRMRKAQLFMPIYSRFYDQDFLKPFHDILHNWEWKDLEDYGKKYGYTNLDAASQFSSVINYFRCVGSLVQRNQIEPELVSDLMQLQVIRLWEKIEPLVNDWKTSIPDLQVFDAYEYLYHEMKRMEQQNTTYQNR